MHGAAITPEHRDAMVEAGAKGTIVIAGKDDGYINGVFGRELDYIVTLLENGSVKNYRSLFNYLRKEVDSKAFF